MPSAILHVLPPPSPEPCHPFPGFLAALGFAGLEILERPILCALVTGDPLLLVGPHGSAKSAVVWAIADSLDLRFHAYDASKALFEDVIGFPDPSSLAEGVVRYVPTCLTPACSWRTPPPMTGPSGRARPSLRSIRSWR